ncbi:MAG: hypothetical protein O2807_04570 [bacterium]|nr:hypothetical protein [bacterium]
MKTLGLSFRWRSRAVLLFGLAFFAFALSGCLEFLESGPQTPGRAGLFHEIQRFELAAQWKNWPYLLESFYLPEHRKEMDTIYDGDPARWFREGFGGQSLSGGIDEPDKQLCVLALRERHVTPRFEPHYVVYYRIQDRCHPNGAELPKGAVEGRMEWGFEVKERRWVHLRAVR